MSEGFTIEHPDTVAGFAARACYVCLPDAKRKVETPGWNN